MLQAVHKLINDMKATLRLPERKLCVEYVDFSKAFNTLNTAKLLIKLEHIIGKDHRITRILREILAYNYVQIDDNTAS